MEKKKPGYCDWLKNRRGEISYAELERRTEQHGHKVSKQYINNIEKHNKHPKSGQPYQPTKPVVDALAYALGVPKFEARYQFFLADLPEANSQNGQRAAHLIEKLPIDKQGEMLQHLELLARNLSNHKAKAAKAPRKSARKASNGD